MSLNDIGNSLGSKLSPSTTYIVSSFLSVALYNFLELTFILFLTFKRRSGLYFWSFLAATWGIAPYSIGFILKDFDLANSISYFYVTLIVVGWCMMVTGQSMVLYSRLHLIMQNRLMLRLVLGMIIIDAIILHIPTIVLCYGANSPLYPRFTLPYAVYEKVQLSVFFVQESIISGLYLYETCKLLRSEGTVSELHSEAGQKLLLHLIYMNVIVVGLDISILILEYAGEYASQTAIKGFIYSVKLKLEFNILNRLVEFVQRSGNADSGVVEGDGSHHSWILHHEEQAAGGVHHPQFCCSWIVFARKVQHELGVSVERYVSRVIHVTQRSSGSRESAGLESVVMAPEMVVQPGSNLTRQ